MPEFDFDGFGDDVELLDDGMDRDEDGFGDVPDGFHELDEEEDDWVGSEEFADLYDDIGGEA